MWTYNYTQYSDELYHYGVKGMRWGHRKSEYSSSYNDLRTARLNKRRANRRYNRAFAKDKVKVKNTDTLSKDSLNRDYDKAQKVVIAENIARAMATDKGYVTSAALNGGLTTTAMIYGSRTKSKVNSLHNSGLTNAEIAKRLNIPASSVSKILNKKKK